MLCQFKTKDSLIQIITRKFKLLTKKSRREKMAKIQITRKVKMTKVWKAKIKRTKIRLS